MILFYFALFFMAVITSFRSGGGQLKDILSGKTEPGILFCRLIAGIFFFGIGTASLVRLRNLDLEIFIPSLNGHESFAWLYIAFAAATVGVIPAFKKISPNNNSSYSLPFYLPPVFIIVRTLFLIMYEFFFRGLVLFVMLEDFGVAVAVGANLILYVLIHWFDKQERYGSILMGAVLCSVTLYYHSVWPAVIIHLVLSLTNEITLLINNKSLIKKSWS